MTDLATLSYCSRNPDTDVCKQACSASTGTEPSTPGFTKNWCNNLYQNYCADQANQSRPICACNLPWDQYPGAKLVSQSFPNFQEPLCWFSSCKTKGYYKGLPSNLCPKCLQNLTINIGADSQADINNISQSCSSGSASAPTVTPLPSAQTAPVAAPSSPTSWVQANAALAGIIGVAAVVLIILLVTLF